MGHEDEMIVAITRIRTWQRSLHVPQAHEDEGLHLMSYQHALIDRDDRSDNRWIESKVQTPMQARIPPT
jgi:hypothetical protein